MPARGALTITREHPNTGLLGGHRPDRTVRVLLGRALRLALLAKLVRQTTSRLLPHELLRGEHVLHRPKEELLLAALGLPLEHPLGDPVGQSVRRLLAERHFVTALVVEEVDHPVTHQQLLARDLDLFRHTSPEGSVQWNRNTMRPTVLPAYIRWHTLN